MTPWIARLIEAGAAGYCLKGIPSESLILVLRSVAAGASWWDQTATTAIRAAFEENNTPVSAAQDLVAPENQLTKRDQEILALVAAGKSNQEIAEILYIAGGTVRVHVHAILQKLEVRDRLKRVLRTIALKPPLLSAFTRQFPTQIGLL